MARIFFYSDFIGGREPQRFILRSRGREVTAALQPAVNGASQIFRLYPFFGAQFIIVPDISHVRCAGLWGQLDQIRGGFGVCV